jgi:hypothetical protein
VSHSSLENHFKTIFALTQHHKWNGEYIENLVPYERDIYVELLNQYLKTLEK